MSLLLDNYENSMLMQRFLMFTCIKYSFVLKETNRNKNFKVYKVVWKDTNLNDSK
jgi:hypothetical protein